MIIEQKIWPVALLINVIQDMQPGFARRPNLEHVGIAQLRTNNVSNEGNIDLSEIKYVEAKETEIEKYGVYKGDVIFNNTNSPDLVGRAAYFDLDRQFVLSNHMTRLRVNPDLLDAEFLARYLNYLWHVGASSRWAKHWVNQAAIDQSGLEKFEIPLPPLPEQRRIVAVLRKADELRQLRRQANQRAKALLPALFDEMFGDCDPEKRYPNGWRIEPLNKYFADTQYGISLSLDKDSDTGIGVLRMSNITFDGELNLTDMKYISPETIEVAKYDLRDGDILFNRTNSPDLVGKTGIWDDTISGTYTFASYIIRVRLKSEALPEYIWALLNSPYGKYQMSRLAKQAVSMANINTHELGSIMIVLPPKAQQEKFKRLSSHVRNQLQIQNYTNDKYEDLFNSLLARAFTGELTAIWRQDHEPELAEVAAERDRLLSGQNILHFTSNIAIQSRVSSPTLTVTSSRAIFAELDPSTQTLLTAAQTRPAYFRSEDLIANHELTAVQAEAGLHVLEALGFVRQVALEGQLVYRTVDAIHESAAKPEPLQ